MTPAVTVRQAGRSDAAVIQAMLEEAAQWVDALGEIMWEEGELAPARVWPPRWRPVSSSSPR